METFSAGNSPTAPPPEIFSSHTIKKSGHTLVLLELSNFNKIF